MCCVFCSINPLFIASINLHAGGVSAGPVFSRDVRQLHGDSKQPSEPMSESGAEGRKTRCGCQTFWSAQTSRFVCRLQSRSLRGIWKWVVFVFYAHFCTFLLSASSVSDSVYSIKLCNNTVIPLSWLKKSTVIMSTSSVSDLLFISYRS